MGAFRDFFKDAFKWAFEQPILKVVDAIGIDTSERRKNNAIWLLQNQPNIKRLNHIWDTLSEEVKSDPEVEAFYQSKLEELSMKKLEDDTSSFFSWLGEQIAEGVYKLETNALPKIEEWIDRFGESYNIKKEELEAMKELARSGEFGLFAVAISIIGITVYPFAYAYLDPYTQKIRQKALKDERPALLSPDELIRLKWREPNKNDHVIEQLQKQGYTDEDIEHLELVRRFYPSVGDWIRFTVRDIFRKEIVERYGYEWGWDEVKDELKERVAKIGMDLEILKWYWLAHWELPSPTQAIEMVHRRAITEEDFKTLLKIADIAPYYVDAFLRIIYSPYTRVDVRRMYKDGVLTKEDVYNNYRDIGYDDEHAKRLTEWTVKQKVEKEKDLTLSQIRKAYRIGKITKERFKEYLVKMGYDEDESALIIAIEDYMIEQEEIEDEIVTLKTRYVKGEINESELTKALQELKLPMKEVDYWLNRAKREKARLIRHPSKTDLQRWYVDGIITENEFREKMRKLKFSDKDIDHYVDEIKKHGGK